MHQRRRVCQHPACNTTTYLSDESAITHFQQKCFYFPVLVKSLVGYTTLTEELIKICMISHNKDTCTEKLQLSTIEYFQIFSPKTLKNVHVMKLQILSKTVHFQGNVLVLFRLPHSVSHLLNFLTQFCFVKLYLIK